MFKGYVSINSLFSYSSKCSSKCSSRDGTWSSYEKTCTVTKYLVGFCFRVNKVNDAWQLDQPP